MNYIGSKLSLLNFIENSINEITNREYTTFCDLFAGTGAVGRHFKSKGCQITANDIQFYSYVLNKHYIGNHKILRFNGLKEYCGRNAKNSAKQICEFLDSMEGKKGFIFNNYCPEGTQNLNSPRMYFTNENGAKCDSIRERIEAWYKTARINEDEYFFLLASLLESIDKVANTASVYGAYLKKFKNSALKPLTMSPAPLLENNKRHFVYNCDANLIASEFIGDILYLDPPYNARQYSSNYHLLETIARYDSPDIKGKTGLRETKNQKSQYCSKTFVKAAFSDLIQKAKAKYIFLSYNNEGLLSPNDIQDIMSKKGEYGCVSHDYKRFKADLDLNRNYASNTTTEFLHYVRCN